MRGGVRFEAMGAQHELRYTTNALCELEDEAGRSVAEMAALMGSGETRMADLRLMFRAGLGDGRTLAEAGDLMDALGLVRVAELVGQAFQAAFPEDDGAAEGTGKKTRGAAAA